jgi:hypothetical protein
MILSAIRCTHCLQRKKLDANISHLGVAEKAALLDRLEITSAESADDQLPAARTPSARPVRCGMSLYFDGDLLNMRSILSSREPIVLEFTFAASIAWAAV